MHIIILPLQTGEIVAKSKIKAIEASADGIVPESNTFLPGNCQMHSCVKKNELQSSVRKALSPIKTNVNQKPLNELSSTDQLCPALFEPITPQRPCNLNSPNKSEMVGPSLDKFHARSSNLKVYKKIYTIVFLLRLLKRWFLISVNFFCRPLLFRSILVS